MSRCSRPFAPACGELDPGAARRVAPRTGTGEINPGNALFFLLLLSLMTTLHDDFQPVHAYRVRHPEPLPA